LWGEQITAHSIESTYAICRIDYYRLLATITG